MSASKKICAGIVLYNPEIELLKKNISILEKQVEKIYLFDNGSSNNNEIKNLFNNKNEISYFFNKQNKGIGYGLNWLINRADENGYTWCLTMDQDSICSDNLIYEYKKHLKDKRVALISPFVLNNDKVTLNEYNNMKLPEVTEITDPMDCITSACLTNIPIVKKLGMFNEKLFIDFVDSDINCKVLNNGYRIIQINDAYMIQQMGKGHKVKTFEWLFNKTHKNIFRRLKVATVYTDQRLYYSSRNSRYIRNTYKDHGRRTGLGFMFAYYCYFTLFYPKNRSRFSMWKAIIKGFKDYKELGD
ncbi:glycosyltransferase [Limosilactobacillus reuteri]|uniref:glycosyltransferase n=1 Tax=Limosilactobacillus reuteri TaxID=1598 RepID=UPI001E49248C|nr:glycosyltransferase [Limosilactobacillus reuteri]MCC4384125.1 glycosyltransferase [Limosilactobacillus reuteri]MCC4419967.1 glycosyltransferase [Limosilactobacillus reuteri]MCC4421295.1 glycosyltransferase [Limosilactobacillus reuteri]